MPMDSLLGSHVRGGLIAARRRVASSRARAHSAAGERRRAWENECADRCGEADDVECRDLMVDADGGPVAEWEHGHDSTGFQSRGLR